jgi:hypothetical protein
MPTHAVKAESIRMPSAATTMADRKGTFRHAEAPASEVAAVAADFTAVVVADFTAVAAAGIGKRKLAMPLAAKTLKRGDATCGEPS